MKYVLSKHLAFLLTLLTIGLFFGCGQSPTPTVACLINSDCAQSQVCIQGKCATVSLCQAQADCPPGEYCNQGYCSNLDELDCSDGNDCPQGYRCLSNGSCQAGAECEFNTDCCPPGQPTCGKTCQNFVCVGTECNIGQQEPCHIGCHEGTKNCDNGNWTTCSATPVMPTDICDDLIDNDCNGQTDEGCPECTAGATQECFSACGSGTQICGEDLIWGECDAPTDCNCSPGQTTSRECEQCGNEEGNCGPGEVWIWSGICLSQGECEGNGEAETETADCGRCGTQTRSCGTDCIWGEWTGCQEEGSCTPDDTEQRACGICGGQVRVCGENCEWGDWGECEDGGGCTAGEIQTQDCGLCGQRTAECDNSCQWGAFGACENEGACSPGMVDDQPCGACGTQTRFCLDNCSWGNWTVCDETGECSPGDSETDDCGPLTSDGICEQGTRFRSCEGACTWSPWSDCAGAIFPELYDTCGNGLDDDCDGTALNYPDEHEPNNSCYACKWLGEDPEEVTLYGTFDNVDDLDDYYCFNGDDNSPPVWCPWCNEKIQISLTDQPVGMDADLKLYQGYENCVNGEVLDDSISIGTDDENIEWVETNGNDDAVYIIRVQSWEDYNCYQPYTLTINGLR
ncbi:MAG: hypothetical protein CMH54_10970 [Myxococcales bacterium]|nr:hypothetical protein [Myxococcales bacterium]